jgi:polyribonucleotide nucleotidyltransferase
VPVNSLCAGVNIGLAGSTDEPVLLTDITDSEKDHGQMRLAIAGTTKGINALQLDTKNNGVSLKNFTNALSNGKEARADIIEAMQTAVAGSAYNHPENAPLIVEIPREHIGRLIGKGGTNIRQIEDSTEAKITVENNQYAIIEGSKDAKNKVLEKIEAETRHYHVGEDFKATVREFLPYGAIVELEAGREALLHVSELRDAYVEKTEDLLKVGDEVPVTIVETSSDGRIKVSIREKYPEFFNDSATTPDQI